MHMTSLTTAINYIHTIIKMNKTFKFLPLIAGSAMFVGCQDYDFGVTNDTFVKKEFAENFEKAFGKIDPEQDWNLATRTVANVELGEAATVKIYSESPLVTSAKLIANYPVENSRSFEFDLPEGTKEVYVQAVSKRGAIVSGYYDVVDGVVNVTAHGAVAATRATDPCATTVAVGDPTTLHVYYGSEDSSPIIKEIKIYDLENVHAERATPWKVGDFRKVLDTYTDANGASQDGVFKEKVNNWRKWVKTGTLTGDVEYTMASTGPVSLTLNYCRTSTTGNCLAYYYYSGNTRPNIEDLKLYNLIPNATDGGVESATDENRIEYNSGSGWNNYGPNGADLFTTADETQVKGTTYDLVYFDGAEPSFDFPVGTKIGFAVVQKNNATGVGTYNTDKCWFSVESMNPKAASWGFDEVYDTYMPVAATFKMGDVKFLGLEDWPDVEEDPGKGSDLNDLLFFPVGDFEEDIPDVDPDPVKYTQDWLLVYEDLGNSFDWDYNDVVLKVEYVSGETTASITALAAGGTLSSHVFYDSDDLGEIHTWFGQEPAVSGANTVTNASSRGTAGIKKTITVPETFSMTTLGSVADMGGIILKVKKAGESDFSSETTTIAYSLENKGTAPEVICLPASWTYTDNSGNYVRREFRWPAELQNIDKAYAHFKDWAANKDLYPGWYAEDPDLDYCVTGTFEQQVSAPEDRIDLTKSPANLALVGAVREVTMGGDDTSANYALAVAATDYTTDSDAEVSYESSNTSLITVAVEEGQLVITRQTTESGVAYVKIAQAVTETHTAAKVDYIKVTLEEKALENVTGKTKVITGESVPNSGWGAEPTSVYKYDLSAFTLDEGKSATIVPADGDCSQGYCNAANWGSQNGQSNSNWTASADWMRTAFNNGAIYVASWGTPPSKLTITFSE